MKDIISDEQLYDENNGAIVLCDAELEAALDVRALHLSEIRDFVLKQLETVRRAADQTDRTQPEKDARIKEADIAELKTCLDTVTVKVSGNGNDRSSVTLATSPTPTPAELLQKSRPVAAPTKDHPLPQSLFTVTPNFRKVLGRVLGVPPNQNVFTYDEVRSTLLFVFQWSVIFDCFILCRLLADSTSLTLHLEP